MKLLLNLHTTSSFGLSAANTKQLKQYRAHKKEEKEELTLKEKQQNIEKQKTLPKPLMPVALKRRKRVDDPTAESVSPLI